MSDRKIERIKNDLGGMFWTRMDEMLDEIEDAGYPVEFMTEEYVTITIEDDDDDREYILYLGWANRTMWIENIREA